MGFARRLFLLDLCRCLPPRFFLCCESRPFARLCFRSCLVLCLAALLSPLFFLSGYACRFTSFRLGSLLGFGFRFQACCLTRLCLCQRLFFGPSLCFSF